MIIIILNSLPFSNTSNAIKESINECILVVICYHLLLVTDFVPDYELDIKTYNGYSIISLIIITIVVYKKREFTLKSIDVNNNNNKTLNKTIINN